MKKSLSALCALPILLAAGVLSLSSCAETLMNATSNLVVVSPQSRLYTGKPTLEFSSSNILSATLNGSSITVTDKAVLTASQTGLNVLELTEKDSGGKTLSTVTVNYFVNDLNPEEAHFFGDLTGWTDNSADLALVAPAGVLETPASADTAKWGSVGKAYVEAASDPVMMKVDVATIVRTGAYASVGFQQTGTLQNQMVAQVVRTAAGLTLNIRDTGAATQVRASADHERSSWSPVSVYFFRDSSNYHAAVIGSDGSVLTAAKIINYIPTITMNRRSIILGPNDSSSTAALVTADNYFYYK